MTWCVSNGTILQAYGTNLSSSGGCTSGNGIGMIYVQWTNAGNGSITLTSSAGDAAPFSLTVAPALDPGTISTNLTQTIPYNSIPGTINCTAANYGSCSPTFVYQWQQSTDNVNWADLAANTQNRSFSTQLQSTTYYRRKVTETNTSTVAYSNTATVFVNPPFSTTQIAPLTQDIYTGTIPVALTGPAASGGSCGGNYTYQWQFSTDGGITFNNVTNGTGSTSTSYTPAALTTTTYFRREDFCGSDYSFSNSVPVKVHAHLAAGAIIPTGPLIITYNSSPGNLTTSNATGGACTALSYQWQQSTDGTNFTDIGAPGYSQLYNPGNMIKTTYFRCKYSCDEVAYSNVVLINVNPILMPGSIFPSLINISSGTSAGQLTANPASGGNCSSLSYQWQQSPDGQDYTFTNISGATSANYAAPALTVSTWYRRKVSCGIDIAYTNSCKINVNSTAALYNYIQVRTISKEAVLTENDAAQLTDPTDVKQTTQYFDGLGRVIQTVSRQSSPTLKDMVVPNIYDEFGREPVKYLPYTSSVNNGQFKPNAFQEQIAFNSTQFPGEQYFYSKTEFEASPLNRPLFSYAPGNDWVGSNRGSGIKYWANTTADAVRIWAFTESTGGSDPGTISSGAGSFYAAASLNKTVSTDESGNQTIEFKDFQGKVILKKVQLTATADDGSGSGMTGWICTYYIYDDFNNLRAVIQPEGVNAIPQTGSWTSTAAFVNNWMFVYNYDQRNRMISKQVPGATKVLMLYDKWDRLVLTQDGNLRSTNTWLFTKYDVLNRPIITGSFTDSRAQTSIQTDIDNSARFESINTSVAEGYSLTNFPSSSAANFTILTETFYDNYSNLPASGNYATYTGNGANYPMSYAQKNDNIIGQVVATRTRVLGTTNFLKKTVFYDDKYRVLESHEDNQVGGTENAYNRYSFDGKPIVNCQDHGSQYFSVPQGYQSPMTTVSTYTYSPNNELNRLDYFMSYLNEISGNYYSYGKHTNIYDITRNELGQPVSKKLNVPQSSDNNLPWYSDGYFQKLDYSYNIRGWLTGINKPYTASTGYDEKDLFNLELHYNTTNLQGGIAQFNGNIAEQVWKGGYDEYLRGYKYTYDKANRLKTADYGFQYVNSYNSPIWDFSMKYNENINEYDLNGNIKQLDRFHGSWNRVDQLAYSYADANNGNTADGNHLHKVVDNIFNNVPVGFKDKDNWFNDYNYDANGNLTNDYNKDISSIQYNYLNLPSVVNFGSKGKIEYLYDAAGTKLQKTVTDQTVNPNKITITKYAGAFVYNNSYLSNVTPGPDNLEFISQPEGRIRPIAKYTDQPLGLQNLTFTFDYFLKDHLGNTRMVLATEQQTDYYAATQEPDNATKENQLFNNISSTNSAKPSGFDSDAGNTAVSKVNGNSVNTRIGPSIILKVMAGDVISVATQAWYSGATQAPQTGLGPIKDQLLTLLTNGIAANNGTQHGAIPLTDISNGSSAVLDDFLSNNQPYNSSRPKAFLNWVIVDEEFKKVNSSFHMGAVQVPAISGTMQKQSLVGPTNLTVRRNGWLYVYLSNESNQDVYFDDLVINHKRGPVVDQTNYYPFGLEIPGLASKAIGFGGSSENRYKFNGKELQSKEFSDGSGLEQYDFGARNYDPQIGMWHNLDPHSDNSRRWSPYAYGFDNPIRFIDPDGMDVLEGEAAQGAFRQLQQETHNRESLEAAQSNKNYENDIAARYVGAAAYNDQDGGGDKRKKINGQDAAEHNGEWIPAQDLSAVTISAKVKRKVGGVRSSVNVGNGLTLKLPGGPGGSGSKPLLKFIGFRKGFIPEFESSLLDGSNGGAVTPGPLIIYPTGGAKDPYYNTHEPGHVLQFLILGPLYYPLVAAPSLLSAGTLTSSQHASTPWEKSATSLWYWSTGESDPSNPHY